MFRAPLCPSSGALDDSVGYHIGRLVLELLLVGGEVQAGWMSVQTEGCNRDRWQTLVSVVMNLRVL